MRVVMCRNRICLFFPRDELTDRGRGGCEADGVRRVAAAFVNLSRQIPSSGTRVRYSDPSCLLGSQLYTRDLGPTLESMAHFLTVCRG